MSREAVLTRFASAEGDITRQRVETLVKPANSRLPYSASNPGHA